MYNRNRKTKYNKLREGIAWSLLLIQSIYFFLTSQNESVHKFVRNPDPLQMQIISKYENPIIYKDASSTYGTQLLISHEWHSNGSPHIHKDLKQGSCWCSADDYCLCNPSLAIDTILVTPDKEYFWLVQRKDVGKFATMGGFVEVGETPEQAVRRELYEEMHVDLNGGKNQEHSILSLIELFGIYGDPLRDARRHTVSIVYVVHMPADCKPRAGDDAKSVVKVHFSDVDKMEFFADHKQILLDYIEKMGLRERNHEPDARSPNVAIQRDLCQSTLS